MSDPPHIELLLALTESVRRPVFATVSGAHLYGFESPDSDVDLRGAFVLPEEAYLGVDLPEDTVSVMDLDSGVELDWVAYDISKSLRLIARGSGEVFEQVVSPLVVRTSPWHEELRDLTSSCVTRGLHRHYAGFLHSRRELLKRESPTVKVLLYAYRAALTGIHVLRTGKVVAHLPTLLESYPLPGVQELVLRKREGDEKGALQHGEAASHSVALDRLDAAMQEAHKDSTLPKAVTADSETYRRINDFLLRIRSHEERS